MKKHLKPAHSNSPKIFLIIGILIIFSLACNLPLMAQTSPGADETARIEISVRETLIALEGDNDSDGDDQSGDDSEDITPSETPEPVISDTPTLTPTVTDTPTPEVAMIYASANTNCRTGQGTFFEWLVTVQQGEEVEAVGIDTSGDYWYVRRPDHPSGLCWLWGKYATPSGPYQSLPVFTPIPTPTPGFEYKLTYINVNQCMSFYAVNFQIDNIGSHTLESWKSSGTDNSGGLINTVNEQDKFYLTEFCALNFEQGDLTPGEGSYLNAVFNGDPTGHDLTLNIKVCTEDGLGGDCLKKTFDITP